MKKLFLMITSAVILSSCGTAPDKPIIYPVTEKGNVVDTIFGTPVPDPYRWLEDDMSEKTALWVEQYDIKGTLVREIELPGPGSAAGFSGKKNEKEIYFSFTNYTTPAVIYKMDPQSGETQVYKKPRILFNDEEYTSEQVFYNSKDGTKVPMIITYKKTIVRNGMNPTMLYGYGGFNSSTTPGFSVTTAEWLELGGVYAVANIRGGGEYGEEWHLAGTRMNKQNVFDDFIAAAEYLIANKYTSSDYLAIRGGSNGGLLVGAVITQRPDLMKVAIPMVGVMDMLRYHKFTQI